MVVSNFILESGHLDEADGSSSLEMMAMPPEIKWVYSCSS